MHKKQILCYSVYICKYFTYVHTQISIVRHNDGDYIIQCNNPLFVGNGDVCGLDSDGDGFPDAELKCDDQFCRMVHT